MKWIAPLALVALATLAPPALTQATTTGPRLDFPLACAPGATTSPCFTLRLPRAIWQYWVSQPPP